MNRIDWLYGKWRNTYNEGCNWSKTQCLVATEIGVTQEGAKQGGEIGGAIEYVEESGCGDTLHIENRSHIH